jgi:biotin carboxyl carrier protein
MSKRVAVIVEGREYIVEVGDLTESPIRATVDNRTYLVTTPGAAAPPDTEPPSTGPVQLTPGPEDRDSAPGGPDATGSAITAPMPGNITAVKVKAGEKLKAGDVVCVLEAMKMNNMIYADRAGVIASVEVTAGQAVDYGAPLVIFQ